MSARIQIYTFLECRILFSHLSEAEASPREHSFCILKPLDLIGACLFAQIKILHDQVACSVQVRNDSTYLLQVSGSGRPNLLGGHECGLSLRLGSRLSSESLGVTCTSLLGISHQLCIVLLSSFL